MFDPNLKSNSIKNWKIKRALELYKAGISSIGQAAHFAEVSIWKFIDLLKENKIQLNYDLEELSYDLKAIKWKQ